MTVPLLDCPRNLRRTDYVVLGGALTAFARGEPEFRPPGALWSTAGRLIRFGLVEEAEQDEHGRTLTIRARPDAMIPLIAPLIAALARLSGPRRRFFKLQARRINGRPLQAIRAVLRDRDGDDCCHCGRAMLFDILPREKQPPTYATVEHGQIPFSLKPTYEIDELSLACLECNHRLGLAWQRYRSAEARLMRGAVKSVDGWPALWDAEL